MAHHKWKGLALSESLSVFLLITAYTPDSSGLGDGILHIHVC
jgi:hypothetical protein